MASEIIVLVCDSAEKAATAKAFLQGRGFTEAEVIFADIASTFIYNAATYDGGGSAQLSDKWVVIGSKT